VVPPSSDGSRGKHVTRRTILSRRDALTAEERAAASTHIAGRVVAELAPRLGASPTVALYAAKGSEVDTTELDAALRARGARVVYPRLVDDRRELLFKEVPPAALEPSRWGLREPPLEAGADIPLGAIDVFVIPGLAFDRGGGRVGWGRGHYDATLTAAPAALRIGIAFECQVVDQVPRDSHDALLHLVVTEVATYRTA
jgi:5-formyltetrahydrofolate cyclo-ligase